MEKATFNVLLYVYLKSAVPQLFSHVFSFSVVVSIVGITDMFVIWEFINDMFTRNVDSL